MTTTFEINVWSPFPIASPWIWPFLFELYSAMRATSCFNICFGLNTEYFAVMRNSNHLNSGCFHVCGFQGAAVLRMLSEFLTEPVFARGLSVSINPVIGPRNLITTATVSTDVTNQSKSFYNYDFLCG